jgi:hypothetical protein
MELTLLVNGTPDEIRRVLHLIERAGGPSTGGPSTGPAGVSDRRLTHVVHWSSGPMVAVMRVVVKHSLAGEAVARPALLEASEVGGEAELNGVLGSIGRAWAGIIGGENPFLGRGGGEGEVEYQIDRGLAERLAPLLATWTDHGGRRRGGRRRMGLRS